MLAGSAQGALALPLADQMGGQPLSLSAGDLLSSVDQDPPRQHLALETPSLCLTL